MEAMSKQVVPVLYEELYQLNFLPVLYGPSTGRIVPPTGQSLWRHAPDQHPGHVLQNFFRQTSVPWAALAYGDAGSGQKPAVSRLFLKLSVYL